MTHNINSVCIDYAAINQQCVVYYIYAHVLNKTKLLAELLRTSNTATETTKKVVIAHTHYNFFSQLQDCYDI